MKRLGIILALSLMLFGVSNKVSAQFFSDMPDMKGKFTYGGDFNFGLYGSRMNFSIAPQVGYRIFSPWEVGMRGVYNLKCYFYNSEYFHYLGFAPFTSIEFFRGLFTYAEYENLYGFARYHHESVGGEWYRSVFVGGGYRSYSFGGSYYYFMLLYNLNWDYPRFQNDWLYPYGAPLVIRVGFCF